MKCFIFSFCSAFVLFSSCQTPKEEPVVPDDFSQIQQITQQATRVQTAIQALVQFTLDIMDKAKVNGRVSAETGDVPSCASIQADLKTKTIAVDFGSGCETPYGTIKGSVLISYSAPFGQAGASISLKMSNFSAGGTTLNGTVALTEFKKTSPNQLDYKIKMTDVDIAYQSTSFRTAMDMAQSWKNYQTTASSDDEIMTSLKGNYVTGDVIYTVETTTGLLVKGACANNVAVSGIMKISLKGIASTLDYGPGTCDSIGALTVGNQTKTIELR